MAVLNRLHLSTLLFGLAMELGAVYPIVLYFTPTQVGVWGVLLYLLLGVVAGWVVYAEVEQIGRVRLLLTGIGAVAAVLIPLAFHWTLWGGALLLCVAYWRGVMLSQYSEHPRWVSSAVMELVAMMLGTLLLPVFSQQPMFSAAAAPYYLLLFAGGLATLASARADLLRRRWEGGMGRRERTVMTAMAAIGIAVVVVPAILAWALGTPYLPLLAHAMGWLGYTVLLIIGTVIGVLLLYPAMWLAELYKAGLQQTTQAPSELDQYAELQKMLQEMAKGRPAAPEWVGRLLGFLVIAAVIALVLIWVYRSISRRYRLGADEEIPEERFSLRSIPVEPVAPAAARPGVEPLSGDTLAVRVRRLYRRLQQAGSRLGRGRRPGETPLEYARELAGTTLGGAAATVTELYTQVRYAEGEPERRQVDEAERLVDGQGRR